MPRLRPSVTRKLPHVPGNEGYRAMVVTGAAALTLAAGEACGGQLICNFLSSSSLLHRNKSLFDIMSSLSCLPGPDSRTQAIAVETNSKLLRLICQFALPMEILSREASRAGDRLTKVFHR